MGIRRVPLEPPGHWTWRGDSYSYLSQGWIIGDLVYTGGQVALADDGGVIAPWDVVAQTRVVYNNIKAILAQAGAGLDDVFKINSFYVCHGDRAERERFWETMAQARGEFFSAPGPCGTGVLVEELVYAGLVIEVEAIATLPTRD